MDSPFTISAQPGADLIHVVATGLWTSAQVQGHFRDLNVHLRRMRVEKGYARILIDMREALVQPTDTAMTLFEETRRAYRAQDRVAVVCTRALVAIQIKHGAAHYARATFTGFDEAQAWLAEDGAAASAPVPRSAAAR